jgi:hypothetical protein
VLLIVGKGVRFLREIEREREREREKETERERFFYAVVPMEQRHQGQVDF